MSDVVRTITSAIKSEISTELGANYSELGYVLDITKNSYRQNNNRYGVIPKVATQIDGVTRYATYSQEFEFVLTKGYGQSQISDEKQRTAALDMFQLAHQIHKRLVDNKAGSPANVMNVNELVIEEPEYLTDEKVAILRASVQITYRISLS